MSYTKKNHFENIAPKGAKLERIRPNVMQYRTENETGIILHSTIIAKKISNESEHKIQLNSGGWQTPTTKKRINYFINPYGYSITQKNRNWYLGNRIEKIAKAFEDHMII